MKNSIKLILLLVVVGVLACNDKRTLEPEDGPILKLGDVYYGGIVVYVEPNGKHGIIAAINDAAPSLTLTPWSSINSVTSATSSLVYSGGSNTNLIVSALGSGTYAANLCNNYIEFYSKLSDWYLPSKDELNLMFQQKNNTSLFFNSSYSPYWWSSTEGSSSQAWCQKMKGDSVIQMLANKTQPYGVRAVRRF